MRLHHRNMIDVDTELTRHYETMKNINLDNYRVIMECTLDQEIIGDWIGGMVHDYEVQCRRKVALYIKLTENATELEKLNFQAGLYLSTMYEGRQKFVAKQLRGVRDILLRMKRSLHQNS